MRTRPRKTALTLSPIVLAIGLSLAAGTASAQSDTARAKEAYERGVDASKRGDYQKAAEEFARADALAPSAVALQAALDAAVDADDPALGSELVERSARTTPTGALATSVDGAKKKFAGRAGKLKVGCPAASTCLATLDGAAIAIAKPTWTRVGQHTVVVQLDGEAQTKLVDVKADGVAEVVPAKKTEPPPTPPPYVPPTPPPKDDHPNAQPPVDLHGGAPPIIFYAGAGATLLLGGTSIVLALVTRSQHDTFVSSGCDKAPFDGCKDKQSAGRTTQILADVGFGATALAGVATIVIGVGFTDWSGGEPKKSGTMAPLVVPVAGGVVGGYGGRF